MPFYIQLTFVQNDFYYKIGFLKIHKFPISNYGYPNQSP